MRTAARIFAQLRNSRLATLRVVTCQHCESAKHFAHWHMCIRCAVNTPKEAA